MSDRPSPVRGLLLSSLHQRRRELMRFMGWSLVEAVPAFLSGHLVAKAIDSGFLAGDVRSGFLWLGLMTVSVLVGAWGTRRAYLRLAAVVEPFRDDLVRLVVGGVLAGTTLRGDPADTGGVARLTHQVEVVREAYGGLLMLGQGFVVTTVSALLGLFTLVPAVLPLVALPLVIGVGLFVVAVKATAAWQRTAILADEGIAESANTLVTGLRDITACGAQEQMAAMAALHVDAQARASEQVARLAALRTVAYAIGGWLPIVLILVAGPWLLRRGATTGAVLGALTYIWHGVQPALQTLVRSIGDSGLWLAVALRRILEAADIPQPSRPTSATVRQDGFPPQSRDLELREITFSYGPHAEPVVRELTLAIPNGDHLAIVGPSGAGKSTLAGLITGTLQPQWGAVHLGGTPVDALDLHTLSRSRVLIPQQAYVFAGTLGENLTYYNSEATRGEMHRAVTAMGLWPLVERLGGYAADVDPTALSAGERQLITLVRAYLAPAPLFVLDEATCHLDPAAEARAEQAFARRAGTLIVIAHRMSSALRARRILVMDGSHVVVGTHEELLVSSPLYRDLMGYWHSSPVPLASYPHRNGQPGARAASGRRSGSSAPTAWSGSRAATTARG